MIVYSSRLRSPLVNSGRRYRARPSETSLSSPAFPKGLGISKTLKEGVPLHSASRPKVADTSLRRQHRPCAMVRSYRMSVFAKA